MINVPFIKNSFTHVGELDASLPASDLILKLTLNNNSLRYFVQSKSFQQIVFYGNYALHHVKNTNDLIQNFQRLFDKDEILQLNFSACIFGDSGSYAVVPDEMSAFSSSSNKDAVSNLGLELHYEIDEQIQREITSRFPNIEFRHLNTGFLQLIPEYLNQGAEQIFVNIADGYFDVIKFKSANQLQLMNRYEFKAFQDFTYFVLLVSNELKLDRDTLELVLIGEVDINSKIYEMSYRYFRNVSFIQKPKQLHLAKAFDIYPKHLHFNLYNLQA